MKRPLSATRRIWLPQRKACAFGLVALVYALIGFLPWRSMADAPQYRDTMIDQTANPALRDVIHGFGPGLQMMPIISPDGRYIAFTTVSEKLTAPFLSDRDLCLYDRESGTIVARAHNASLAGFTDTGQLFVFDWANDGSQLLRDMASDKQLAVQVATDGTKANANCFGLRISADGRYVVFVTAAGNLVAGDSVSSNDIFVRDTVANTTQYVSLTPLEQLGDRRRDAILFELQDDGTGRLLRHDIFQRITDLQISDDVQIIAFTSSAKYLVANDKNGVEDVFVHDRRTGVTTMISTGNDGAPGNGASRCLDITPDGNYILFTSAATNLVPENTRPQSQLYVADRVKNIVVPVLLNKNFGLVGGISLSRDGRRILIMAEPSPQASAEIYIHDREKGTMVCVSEGSAAIQAKLGLPYHENSLPSMSDDGRYICYLTEMSNATPLFGQATPSDAKWKNVRYRGYAIQVFDRETGKTATIYLATDLPREL